MMTSVYTYVRYAFKYATDSFMVVISGSAHSPKCVSSMMDICLSRNSGFTSACVESMQNAGVKVWEVYTSKHNYELASSFCSSTKEKHRVPLLLLSRALASPEQWRLDKPLVNLAREEDGADFMAVPDAPPLPQQLDESEEEGDDDDDRVAASHAPASKRPRTTTATANASAS